MNDSRGRARVPWGLILVSLPALLGVGVGCTGPEPTHAAEHTAAAALASAHASPAALGRAVLDALAAEDRDALRALRVTRDEWLDLFWPELPESGNTPFDFAWQMKNDHSREAERVALSEFGGQEFEFVDMKFTEPAEVYSTFTVHMGAQLWARRVSDGQVGIIPILSVVVERQGLWKLSNLVD
jgi:hypothetical protein